MNVDMKWLNENYEMFNFQYFDNELFPVNFEIVYKDVSYLGMATNLFPNKPKITMNLYYDLSELQWKNVLLHEMIHIWQFFYCDKGGHGKTFKEKAKEINKDGWDIQTTDKY